MARGEMIAGRELDALIAEQVMGGNWSSIDYAPYIENLPHYSTDIAAAWQVVERMQELRYSLVIGTNACARSQNGAKFYEGWRGLGQSIIDAEETEGFLAVAETVPLAICKAALLAIAARTSVSTPTTPEGA